MMKNVLAKRVDSCYNINDVIGELCKLSNSLEKAEKITCFDNGFVGFTGRFCYRFSCFKKIYYTKELF